MSDDDKAGLKAALEAVGPGAAPGGEAEQLALLPLAPARGELVAQAEGKRGPGRPKGAANKRTEAWASYLLGRYASPLEVLAQVMSRSVDELRAELACSRLEALEIQLKAAKELAPYLHQKQPMAIDAGEGGLVSLTINAAPAAPASGQAVEGRLTLDARVIEENDEKSEG